MANLLDKLVRSVKRSFKGGGKAKKSSAAPVRRRTSRLRGCSTRRRRTSRG